MHVTVIFDTSNPADRAALARAIGAADIPKLRGQSKASRFSRLYLDGKPPLTNGEINAAQSAITIQLALALVLFARIPDINNIENEDHCVNLREALEYVRLAGLNAGDILDNTQDLTRSHEYPSFDFSDALAILKAAVAAAKEANDAANATEAA